MRRLLLLRHAKAEPSEAGTSDQSRVLTERGRRDAANMGAYMAAHAAVPDRVALSPAVRVQQTWQYAVAAFRSAPAAVTAAELYNARPQAILALIKNTPSAVGTLLVVGHNPGLHEATAMLIASGDIDARERLREKLPTTGLVLIHFAFDDWSKLRPQRGRLERFVSPKSLAAAAT